MMAAICVRHLKLFHIFCYAVGRPLLSGCVLDCRTSPALQRILVPSFSPFIQEASLESCGTSSQLALSPYGGAPGTRAFLIARVGLPVMLPHLSRTPSNSGACEPDVRKINRLSPFGLLDYLKPFPEPLVCAVVRFSLFLFSFLGHGYGLLHTPCSDHITIM